MTRGSIPTGWYIDAQPSGAYACLIPGSHIDTHRGRVELPDGRNVLYLRLAPDGERLCGQVQGGRWNDHVAEWMGGEWKMHRHAPAVSPALFALNGELVIAQPLDGSQGLRFIAETGEVFTGDETYFDPALSLSEWTRCGDATIGQGATNDGVVIVRDGLRKRLADGPCRFVRANRDGDRLSVAWYTIRAANQHDAHVAWFDVAEIAALPDDVIAQPTPPPAPAPIPNTPHGERPMPNIADQTDTVARFRAKYPTPIGNTAPLLREVAAAIGQGAGLLHKPQGNNAFDAVSGQRVAVDIICFPDGQHFDALIDADGSGEPSWQDKGFVDPSRYIAVTAAPVPPPVPPPNTPPPDETIAFLRVINAKLDRLLAVFRNA